MQSRLLLHLGWVGVCAGLSAAPAFAAPQWGPAAPPADYAGPADTSPTSPGPSQAAPAAPAPTTPGRASRPTTPAPSSPLGRRARTAGMPMDLKRGNTSKSLLKMRWEFPVYEPPMPEDAEEGQTVARRPAEALPLEQAFAEVAEEDPRPLLILRECQACEGTEKALLRVDENNEKTLLLSKWFRCVKLPVHVLSEDHPFHAFWDEPLPDGRIPHLFFASPDGEIVIPLRGDQSQTELHGAMLEMLERFYKRNGEKRVREITKLLAKLDHYDFLEMAVNQRLDRAIENDGPDSRKARKLMKEKESIEQDRAELLEDYEELLELPLRKEPKT